MTLILPSSAPMMGLVDRILRLTIHEQVCCALTPGDVEALQFRAQEALQVLTTSNDIGGHVDALTFASLAVECINVVQCAELTTGPARLVSVGCEVLAALLESKLRGASVGFEWVDDILEELSDELDFLAIEVYCGLGRLDGITESDTMPDVDFDIGNVWGSMEHRQALQELSAWFLCVVFRAVGLEAVNAQTLMEFSNFDPLCLSALLHGLFACPSGSLPPDAAEIKRAALGAICGLTAPELAFSGNQEGTDIEEQNRVLSIYFETLCAAVVETGLLAVVLDAVLAEACQPCPPDAALGARVLAFVASLALQADGVEATPEDPYPPQLRLCWELSKEADKFGRLLEAVLSSQPTGLRLRELVHSCVILSGVSTQRCDISEDGFTLTCRMLLTTTLDSAPQDAVLLVLLGALAVNVGDLEVSRSRLLEATGALKPDDLSRARARLTRRDGQRLPLRGGPKALLTLFSCGVSASVELVVSDTPHTGNSVAKGVGIREVVHNAPAAFRCHLDGKLLCDPVVSPSGDVFERTTLARYLQQHGRCPVTGAPLLMEDCSRSLEIRKKVTQWVRSEGRKRQPKSTKGKAR